MLVLKRFWPIDAQRYVSNLFKTIPDLSHSRDVTATVRRIFNNTYMFGYDSMSKTFNTFATKSGCFSFGVFHRFSHLENSPKASLGVSIISVFVDISLGLSMSFHFPDSNYWWNKSMHLADHWAIFIKSKHLSDSQHIFHK